MEEIVSRYPPFQRSIETKALVERLLKVEKEETVTYDELTTLIGRDVRKARGYGSLRNARTAMIRDHGINFECVPKTGLIRASPLQTVSASRIRSKNQSRAAQRNAERLNCAEFTKLTQDDQRSFVALMTVFAITKTITQKKGLKKLEGTINPEKQRQLSMEATLEIFKA